MYCIFRRGLFECSVQDFDAVPSRRFKKKPLGLTQLGRPVRLACLAPEIDLSS